MNISNSLIIFLFYFDITDRISWYMGTSNIGH